MIRQLVKTEHFEIDPLVSCSICVEQANSNRNQGSSINVQKMASSPVVFGEQVSCPATDDLGRRYACLHMLKYLLRTENWMAKRDLKDVYFTISVDQKYWHFLLFQSKDKIIFCSSTARHSCYKE